MTLDKAIAELKKKFRSLAVRYNSCDYLSANCDEDGWFYIGNNKCDEDIDRISIFTYHTKNYELKEIFVLLRNIVDEFKLHEVKIFIIENNIYIEGVAFNFSDQEE